MGNTISFNHEWDTYVKKSDIIDIVDQSVRICEYYNTIITQLFYLIWHKQSIDSKTIVEHILVNLEEKPYKVPKYYHSKIRKLVRNGKYENALDLIYIEIDIWDKICDKWSNILESKPIS